MSTFSISGTLKSIAEIGIPCLQKLITLSLYYALQAVNLYTIKPPAKLELNRIKPEFGQLIIPFYMDMWRLLSVSSIEKKPIRACSKYRGHFIM